MLAITGWTSNPLVPVGPIATTFCQFACPTSNYHSKSGSRPHADGRDNRLNTGMRFATHDLDLREKQSDFVVSESPRRDPRFQRPATQLRSLHASWSQPQNPFTLSGSGASCTEYRSKRPVPFHPVAAGKRDTSFRRTGVLTRGRLYNSTCGWAAVTDLPAARARLRKLLLDRAEKCFRPVLFWVKSTFGPCMTESFGSLRVWMNDRWPRNSRWDFSTTTIPSERSTRRWNLSGCAMIRLLALK